MPKNILFMLKNCKNRQALGAPPPPPDPLTSDIWGLQSTNPRISPHIGNSWLRAWTHLSKITSFLQQLSQAYFGINLEHIELPVSIFIFSFKIWRQVKNEAR